MAKTHWTNIYNWIRDMESKNGLFDEEHLFTRIEGMDKTLGQQKAYQDLLQAGRGGFGGHEGHRLSTALARYYNVARDAGFGQVDITQEGEQTYRISFLPLNNSEHLSASECPALIISNTNEYGLTVQNQLPAINAMMVVRKDSGEIGLASAAATGIDEAANALLQLKNRESYRLMSQKQKARAIKTSTRINSNDLLKKNPMASSRHQKNSFKESLSLDKMSEIRSEQARLMAGQVYTSYYYQSLLAAKKNEIYGYNQQLEKQIYRELANFEHHAKNFSNVEDLQKYLKQSKKNFPLIDKYLWKGELENLYKGLYSVGLTFGGKTEGASGVFSLFNAPIPGSTLLPKASRKVAQNLRLLQKPYQEGKTKGFAPNLLHRPGQFTKKELESGEAFKNLYVTAEIAEEHIKAGVENYINNLLEQARNATGQNKGVKINAKNLYKGKLHDAAGNKLVAPSVVEILKGITNDAEIYAEQIMKDFKVSFTEQKEVHRPEVTKILDRLASNLLTRDELATYQQLDPLQKFAVFNNGKITIQNNGQDITKQFLGNKKSNFQKNHSRYLNEAVLEALHLDPKDSNNHISSIAYNEDNLKYAVALKQTLDTKTFTGRGGSTTDNRAVLSSINNDLFVEILKAAGFKDNQIKDAQGNLLITHAQLARDFDNKTVHGDFMGITEYIIGKLYTDYIHQENLNNKQALKKIQATFDKSKFKGLISVDNNGGLIWHEEVLASLLQKNKHQAAGLIKDIGNFGASLGIYRDKEGNLFGRRQMFSIRNGKLSISKDAQFLKAQELGVSSVTRYEGKDKVNSSGEESGMKIDRQVVTNLYNTAGKMRAAGYETEAILLQAQADKYNAQLTDLEDKFKPYERNLDFVANRGPLGTSSFDPNKERAAQRIKQAGGIILTEEDFRGARDVDEYEVGKLKGDYRKTFQGIIQTRQEQQLAKLQLEYLDSIKRNNPELSTAEQAQLVKEELAKRGIYSAKDIQVALNPSGDIRYNYGKAMGGLIMLGRGDIHSANSDDPNMPLAEEDQIAMLNNRMVRDYLKYEHGQLTVSGLGRSVHDFTEDIVEAYSKNGSIWDKYHSFKDTSGGQFLLQGMATETQEILKSIGLDKTKIGGIMNASEYSEMLREAIIEARIHDDVDQLKAYDDLYTQITGKKTKGDKTFANLDLSKKDMEARVKRIVRSLNIDTYGQVGGYAGATTGNIGLYRAPIIKSVDDIIKAGLVVSNKIEKGHLMIDPAKAAIMKGDFDGDRIALSFFKAAVTGDDRYFDWMSEQQRKPILEDLEKARKSWGQKSGDLNKINLSPEDERVKAAAANAGKKESGIFGDFSIAWRNAIHKYGIDWSSIISGGNFNNEWINGNLSQQVTPALAGELFSHIIGSLYQNAINIKNLDATKISQLKEKYGGIAIYPDAQATLENLMGKKENWDHPTKLLGMIGLMQDMGLMETNGKLFKSNILAELGLNHPETLAPNLQRAWAELLTLEESDPKKREKEINKIIKQFGKGKVPTKLLDNNFLTNVGKYTNATLNKHGTSIGDIFANRYKYIPGHENNLFNVFGDRTEEQFTIDADEASVKRAKELGIYRGTTTDGKIIIGKELTGWAKWEDDIESSRAKRLERLRKRTFTPNEETGLVGEDYISGVTSRTRQLLGKSADELLYKAQNYVEEVSSGKTTDLDLWAHSYQSEFNTLKAIFTGNLVHRMAEISAKALSSADNKEFDLNALVKDDPEYKKISKQLDTLYKLKYGDNQNNPTRFSDWAKKIGKGQVALLQEQLKNERLVGQEMSLFTTTSSGVLLSGIADLITAKGTIGGVGADEHVLTVTDYKNYFNGQATPDVVIQLLQYVDSLRLLHDELKDRYKDEDVSSWSKDKIKQEALQFLQESDTGVGGGWKAVIYDLLKTRGQEERAKTPGASEQFTKEETSKFINLFGEVIDPNLRFKIAADIANTKDLSVTRYESYVDNNKAALATKAILGMAIGNIQNFDEKQQEDLKAFLNKTAFINIDEDQSKKLNQLAVTRNDLLKEYGKILTLERRKKFAAEKGDVNAVTSLEEQIEQAEKTYKESDTVEALKWAWKDAGEEAREGFLLANGLGEFSDELLEDPNADIQGLIEAQQREALRKQEETSPQKIKEWRQAHSNIRKYQHLQKILQHRLLQHRLTKTSDDDETNAINAQIADVQEVLDLYTTQANNLKKGFELRDVIGNSLESGGYIKTFVDAQTQQDYLDRQADAEEQKKTIKQYEAAAMKREQLELRKQDIYDILDNSEQSREFSQQEKDRLNDELNEINDAISEYTNTMIDAEADLVDENKQEVPAFTKAKEKIAQKIGHMGTNKAVRDVDSKIATLTKEQQDYHAALQDYANLENAKRKINVLEQKMTKTLSQDQYDILNAERQQLESERTLAEARVNKRIVLMETETSPEHKAYLQGINERAAREAALRASVQQTQMDNATRSRGILGIADQGIGQLLSRFIGGRALYRLLGRFRQTISQLTNEAKALDKAMTNLRIVTGETKDNTRGLISQYSNLAQTLGVTTKAVATSAVEWLRQGYSTSEAMDLIKSSMYLSTLGMIDSAQATKSLYNRFLI